MENLIDKTVLIVDDDDRNIFALASYLETMQMKITIAKDGAEALSLLHDDLAPDIILLDMMMPVMDGYETLAVLKRKEQTKHIPVLAITAKAMKGDKEHCLQAGAWDYISKPLDLKLLIHKMSSLI